MCPWGGGYGRMEGHGRMGIHGWPDDGALVGSWVLADFGLKESGTAKRERRRGKRVQRVDRVGRDSLVEQVADETLDILAGM